MRCKRWNARKAKMADGKHTRVLLIIIIIAALAFLSIAEENFFGRATAIIGSITLVLPNLMTLFGSITRLFTRAQLLQIGSKQTNIQNEI
jgi:hypothetical protein